MCLTLPWSAAQAHLLNMTTVQVNVDGERVTVDLQIDLTRAAGGPAAYYNLSRIPNAVQSPPARQLLDQLAAAVALRQVGGVALPLATVAAQFPQVAREAFLDPLNWPMTHVVLAGRLEPAQAGASGALVRLEAAFLPSFRFEEPIALTFEEARGNHRMTRWLVAAQVSPPFALAAAVGTPGGTLHAERATAVSLRQFAGFGFAHILPGGLDHVLFVLGLYLGARSLRSLLVWVTCFTLAHSITLGLAALGVIRLNPALVEPLISASIVWVAVENLRADARAQRYRPIVVFAFGLVHGLGFASALAALDAPAGSFLPALLAFNVGIELGQLTVIAGAALLVEWCRTRDWYLRRVARPASLIIALIAGVWTLQRVL